MTLFVLIFIALIKGKCRENVLGYVSSFFVSIEDLHLNVSQSNSKCYHLKQRFSTQIAPQPVFLKKGYFLLI